MGDYYEGAAEIAACITSLEDRLLTQLIVAQHQRNEQHTELMGILLEQVSTRDLCATILLSAFMRQLSTDTLAQFLAVGVSNPVPFKAIWSLTDQFLQVGAEAARKQMDGFTHNGDVDTDL